MRGWTFAVVVVLLLGVTGSLQAQGRRGHKDASTGQADPAVPAGYEETVKRALGEFELANYPEARSVLLEAHAMYPNARTLRALGMVEFELKNYASSIDYLEQALASDERPLTPAQQHEAEARLGRANGYIGRYQLAVRPANASLTIDGQTPRPNAQGLVLLAVGDHELEVSAPGHRTLRRTLNVAGGQRETLDVVLLPQTQVETEVKNTPPGPSPRADTPVYKKWWLWTTIGLVVAAGAVTGVVLATREPEPKEPNGGSLNETIRVLSWR